MVQPLLVLLPGVLPTLRGPGSSTGLGEASVAPDGTPPPGM